MKLSSLKFLFSILLVVVSFEIKAQDERAQLPLALRNAYFGVSVGSINYDFGAMSFLPHTGYVFSNVVVKLRIPIIIYLLYSFMCCFLCQLWFYIFILF